MHLLLVDGSTFIFRAYHALPPLTRKSDGLPVGAVSGFCNMLFKLTEDLKGADAPTHMAVIFDHSGKSFRNEFFPEYKAQRPPPPEDLIPQFGLTRLASEAFSIPAIEQEGFEADDLIATYTTQALAAGGKVTIVSTDKDLMQLVNGDVRMLDTLKNRWIEYDQVVEKFGVGPDKVVEVQSLAGDSVDNVPGVPGIGLKTAAQLILEYGDLENLLTHAGEIKQQKRRENLIEFAEQARVSHRLVSLKCDVPVETPLTELTRKPMAPDALIPFLKALEFNTFLRRVATGLEADPDAFGADPELAGNAREVAAEEAGISDPVADHGVAGAAGEGPAAHAAAVAERIRNIPIDHAAYETIADMAALERWIAAINAMGHVAVDTETTGLDNQTADLVGICLSTEPSNGAYIPLAHTEGEGDMFGGGKVAGQLETADVIAALKPVFEDPAILKILQNAKYDIGILARHDITLSPIDDTMLISYALDGARGNSMDALSETWLGHTPIAFKDLAGTGKNQKTFDQLEIPEATKYAAEDADVTMRLWHALKPRLAADRVTTVYETLERPLAPVLARMEARGISVDRQILSRLSGDFAQRAAQLEAEAHEIAGEKFNLGSPKQLGEILFDRMGLEGGTKTKSGAWATGVQVLEDLAAKEVPLAQVILDWRGVTKLKSTYSDALPEYINARTGRVHTSYHQAAVATGRLSSTEPNLQNIPVRTEDGRKIRTAFVAAEGMKLLSADYSQIELRILAHIADIKALKQAFADGQDIHAMTASEIFNTPIEGMDPMVRRQAKAINFGIIYGISAFGLANQLGIPRGDAKAYIDAYFERFPGIKDYMDAQRETVKRQGYVETIFGRKIPFPNANSKSHSERAFVERASINAPIQGSAADIIRRAMIHMEPALKAKNINAAMLLQVHDELIFEVPAGTEDEAIPVISKVMENAATPALQLSVPLQVDAKAAGNWEEAH